MGGRAEGCKTELHDVVFSVGKTLQETYPSLIEQWFGSKKRLHIDSSIELKYVDGHEIILHAMRPEKTNEKKLYFVNFGAYKEGYFGEIHHNNFYVADSKTEALARAKEELCISLVEPHCDDNLDIDDIIKIDGIDGYYIHLEPTSVPSSLHIESYYRRLDLPEMIQTIEMP